MLLKLVLLGMVLPAAAITISIIFMMIIQGAPEFMGDKVIYFNVFISILILATIPYYFALIQTYGLLNLIDQNNAFSKMAIDKLNKIRNCIFIVCGLFTINLPFVFVVADVDDAPGLVLLGGLLVMLSIVVGVFASVLLKLFESAMKLKEDNELTI